MRIALPAVLLLLAAIPFAKAESIREPDVGGWTVVAVRNDDSNEFTGCVVSTTYNSGITLSFLIDPTFHLAMFLSNPDWKLAEGDGYRLSFSFDGSRPIRVRGLATDLQIVEVALDAALFERFKSARMFSVQTARGVFKFILDGSSRALTAALDCTTRRAGSGAPSNSDPFSGGTNSRPADPFSAYPGPDDSSDGAMMSQFWRRFEG